APYQAAPPDDFDDDDYEPRRSGAFLALLIVLLVLLAGMLFLLAKTLGLGTDDDTATMKEVPSVIGETLENATTRLDALGFGVDPTSEANDEFPAGTVFEQDPGPDTEAEEGSTIKLKVSAGAEAKPVPDVVGRDIEEARDIIEEADFVVRETPVADD